MLSTMKLSTMKRGLLVGSFVVVVAALLSGSALAARGHGHATFGLRAAHGAGGGPGFANFGGPMFGGPMGGGFGAGFGGPGGWAGLAWAAPEWACAVTDRAGPEAPAAACSPVTC